MRGIPKDRLHSEKAVSSGFRTGVRFPSPPPKKPRDTHRVSLGFFRVGSANQPQFCAGTGFDKHKLGAKPGFDSATSATPQSVEFSFGLRKYCHSEKLVLQCRQTDKLEFVGVNDENFIYDWWHYGSWKNNCVPTAKTRFTE